MIIEVRRPMVRQEEEAADRGMGASGHTNLFLRWILWLYAIERAPASLVYPIRGLVVLFGFLVSVFILKERPSRRSAIGVLLIIHCWSDARFNLRFPVVLPQGFLIYIC